MTQRVFSAVAHLALFVTRRDFHYTKVAALFFELCTIDGIVAILLTVQSYC